MKAYRLKHIPTGLYFRPSRKLVIKWPGDKYGSWVNSNLSDTGKIYGQKPSFKYVDRFWNHTKLNWTENPMYHTKHATSTLEYYQPQDWMIEEI